MVLLVAMTMLLILYPPTTADCPSDMVSYWKFDEGSGTAVTDAFNGNHGEIHGDPTWVNGMVGKALDFDGSGDYVVIPDDDSLSFVDGDPDEPFSVSAWVYMRNTVTTQRFVGKAVSLGSGYAEYLLTTTGANYFGFFICDASYNQFSFIGRIWNQPPDLEQWYHLVGTYDGLGETSGIKLYVDGVQVDNSDSAVGPYDNMENTDIPVYLGYYPGYSNYLNGKLDEVAIWNKELTSTEVFDLYCLGSNGIGYTDNLEYSGTLLQTSDSITLEATLTNPSGFGVEGCDITFYLDDVDVGSATTNIYGVATLDIGPIDSGIYEVYASVCCLESDVSSLTVNDPPIANANGPYSINEGDSLQLDASASSDLDGDPLTYSWDLDNDAVYGDATGETPTVDWTTLVSYGLNDDGSYTIGLEADDGTATDTDTTTVEIVNVDPTITGITVSANIIEVGTSIDLTAPFTDPGTSDTHTATIDWGDETTSSGTVTETDGSGTVTHSHTYDTGVHTITLTVEDDDDGNDIEIFQYVVVYDPNDGFVTGGGWIDSPTGAYGANPSLTGRANFGFVSKYKKGQSTPTGNTEFKFEIADLDFHSTSYEWLVITGGSKAMFKGLGTINDLGEYKFMITAWDGQINGGSDTFRIKIWYEENNIENIVYDNGEYGTVLGGGQIKIHSG